MIGTEIEPIMKAGCFAALALSEPVSYTHLSLYPRKYIDGTEKLADPA